MTDQEIIDLYWKREETAIAVSANKFGSYCHSISYNILHDNEDAEECVNDTWLGAWKSMPPHRPERLSTFLGKITRNLSLNRFKNMQQRNGYMDKPNSCCLNWKTVSQITQILSRSLTTIF